MFAGRADRGSERHPAVLAVAGASDDIEVLWPPGDPGAPPHRHPGGPAFGYVLEGEMLFELEGEPPRAIKAGEAFWEPGGDVIHYSDGNNRSDIPLRYTVTMICDPGQPMLVVVEDHELEARRDRRYLDQAEPRMRWLRVSRTHGVSHGHGLNRKGHVEERRQAGLTVRPGRIGDSLATERIWSLSAGA